MFFAHAARLFTGVLPEVVIPYCVVEDGAELIVDRFPVHWRVGLAIFVLVVQHLVIDLLGGDVTHFQPAEIGQQLGTDDVVLGGPGVFFESVFHIRCVEVHEAPEGHIQVGAGLVELFPLPSLCFSFGLEAPFLSLLALTVPVGIAINCPPGTGFSSFPLARS